jgi:hypothetical protein
MSLPGASFMRLISGTGSPLITDVLFHSGSVSVEETTYFAIELMWSLAGSPERVGHTGAKTS